MLVRQAKSQNDTATQALWRIAETDDTGKVESILASGAVIDAGNAYGTTALMRAASLGRTHMVRTLLAHGADPNRSRNDKFTPLLLAAFFGHEEIVKILAEHGAQIDAATRFGTSAEMWAASRTFQEVVHYLRNPQGKPSVPRAVRVRESKPDNWSSLANMAVIAKYGPKLQLANESEAAIETARRLVGFIPSADDEGDPERVPEKSQEAVESQEVTELSVPRTRSFRLPSSSSRVGVFASIALLSLVAVVGFTLQRKRLVKQSLAQTPAKIVVNASTVSVRPSAAESLENGGEVPATTPPVETKLDQTTVEKAANPTSGKPTRVTVPRNVFSANFRGSNDPQEKLVNTTAVEPIEPDPTPASVEVRQPELAPAPPTIKPQPTVPRSTSLKRIPTPSPQLITGSKSSSSAKGKVILWP